MNQSRGKWRVIFVVYCLAGAAVIFLFTKGSSEVSTQYATVDCNVHQMAFEVSGRVLEVLVDDNQRVKAGDVLARLDEVDYEADVKEAKGKLEEAKAARDAAAHNLAIVRVATVEGLASAEAAVTAANARYRVAQANFKQKEFERNQIAESVRTDAGSVSLQNQKKSVTSFDEAAAEVESAKASIETVEAARRKALTGPDAVLAAEKLLALAEANVRRAQAVLDQAELDLSYCTVRAPANGYVSHKNIEVGEYFAAQTPMMAIVAIDEPWIVARFREPDIDRIRPGQAVSLVLDAYPDMEVQGIVDSIESGTFDSSSLFSSYMMTARTGYFSWLMQRVPVKIRIPDYQPDPQNPWRLGLNTNVVVPDPEPSNKFFN